jgi:hypothetical protein
MPPKILRGLTKEYFREKHFSEKRVSKYGRLTVLTVLKFCGSFYAVLNPDPNRIRIHNTGL